MALTALRPSQHLIDLVAALRGTWHGYVAMCRCPAHADHTPSLSLRQGDRGVLVTCFAGCDPADVLRELRRVRASGHHPGPPEHVGHGTGNALRLWEKAPPIAGTPAERYVRHRNLPTDLPDLRFHPRCPLGPKGRVVFRPALLIGVREGRQLRAIQRIFVPPDGAGYYRKVMLGQPGQGAWRGDIVTEVLAIAEGFESAGAYREIRRIPTWSSLGARRLHQIELPNGLRRLIIAEDNDPEGRRAAAHAVEIYARPGLEILRDPPPRAFNDWSDVLADRAKRGGGSRG
jgi:hypothetical protein